MLWKNSCSLSLWGLWDQRSATGTVTVRFFKSSFGRSYKRLTLQLRKKMLLCAVFNTIFSVINIAVVKRWLLQKIITFEWVSIDTSHTIQFQHDYYVFYRCFFIKTVHMYVTMCTLPFLILRFSFLYGMRYYCLSSLPKKTNFVLCGSLDMPQKTCIHVCINIWSGW